ncbi:MAG: transposase [Candidatus Moranbacteria bacterium]|nr:transposase [Candidatus Moranbacteria bacterium]
MKTESLLRVSVHSLYQLQKLRIQSGNRIVAAFRDKLGIAPGEAEDSEKNEKAAAVLEQLRGEYKLITDGVKRVTKHFKPDSQLLTSSGEVLLIKSYEQLIDSEKSHIRLLEIELDNYPIYDWLKGVRGVGPMMAAVMIAEIDIHKCNSISALWKYAGLDVVVSENADGDTLEEGRCRKKHHLTPKTYVNRDGAAVDTVGITFNPFLKTKMVGVLGASFIKLGGPYRDIYDGYKHRLQHHPKHQDKTKGHLHNMATRYMIKEFLADCWTTWRTIEGLPVRSRYAEEKLGLVHSKAA